MHATGDLIEIDGKAVFLKGVTYSPFIAGDAPWLPFSGKVNFARDLATIKDELHANAVRIADPLPQPFYAAAKEVGLYVIQGFYVPNNDNLLEADFLERQKAALRDAVDLVLGQYKAGGVIIAFVIGNGLSTATIANTISSNQGHPRYRGTYYTVPDQTELPPVNAYPCCSKAPFEEFLDPHPYQSFIAELADTVAVRANDRYGKRRPIGHGMRAANNSFLGARDRPVPGLELPVDMGFLDIICEDLYTYDYPYITYIGLPDYLRRLKTAYPSKPVLVLETGYSTSAARQDAPRALCGFGRQEPLPLSLTFGGASAEEQALALEARWVDVVSAERPLAGFFVFEYYDQWWYTGEVGVPDDHPLESFGLMRVSGTPQKFTVAEKLAFRTVAELFGCGEAAADLGACGIAIDVPAVIEATYGIPFSHPLAARGGQPPYRWEIRPADALPVGVSLDGAAGRLEGTPERVGTFRFHLRAIDGGSSPLVRERPVCLRVRPPEFSTQGKDILLNGKPFYLNGVDYSAFIAGDAPWSCMRHADPFTDLRDIKKVLHANTIRLYQSLPKSVYDAARENGLFIIQGIHLQVEGPWPESPDCQTTELDLFEPAFFEATRDHVLAEIDEVNNLGGSDVVLCYVVGNELNFCVARSTILKHQDMPRYKGTFYSVPNETRLPALTEYPGCQALVDRVWDPHPLQSFVTKLVDIATIREHTRYGARHLMAHATDPNMSIALSVRDRFHPEEHFPVDLGFLDIVFQNVYSYFPPFIRYRGYDAYLREARDAYPDTPFVILECGYSTSPEGPFVCATENFCGLPDEPMPLSLCFGKNSEEDQARGLAVRWREARAEEGLSAGFFVFEYYDEWWKGSNASEFVQDPGHPEEWFGIKRVSGEGAIFEVANKRAFDTVARMFDMSWCPPAEGLTCEATPGGVRIALDSPQAYDAIAIERNGEVIIELAKGVATYLDAEAPNGTHTYRVTAVNAFVACPALECTVTVAGRADIFRRGDVSADGKVNIGDGSAILRAVFGSGAEPPSCPDAADVNDDGEVTVADAIAVLSFLFGKGGEIAPPYHACGEDPTPDSLSACSYPAELCSP